MDELLQQDIPQIINRLPQRLSQLPPQPELAKLGMPPAPPPSVLTFATEGESLAMSLRDTQPVVFADEGFTEGRATEGVTNNYSTLDV